MSHDDHSFCTTESAQSFLLYTYDFEQLYMIGVTVCLYSFTVIM